MMPMLYLAAAATVVAGAGGFWAGHSVTSNAWKADMARAEREHTQSILRQVERSNDAAAELEAERAKRKIVYRTVTKEVERIVDRPVYAAQCFDPDGVRALNSVISGTPPAESKPDPAMPAPRALGRWDGGKPAAVVNGNSPTVQ